MDSSDELRCLYSGTVAEHDGSYVIEIPTRELTEGAIEAERVYRVGLCSPPASDTEHRSDHQRTRKRATPPVEPGEKRTVEIETLGEQGDGIARVDRGYVVIVPETELHERVTIEITTVTETVAFGDVVARNGDE